jgi:hypothetical protein
LCQKSVSFHNLNEENILKKTLFVATLLSTLLNASFIGTIVDSRTLVPLENVTISDSAHSVKSDKNGSFSIRSAELNYHVKAYGYRPLTFSSETNASEIKVESITVRALYLTFWGASNNSKTLARILDIIDKTEVNAVVVDVKNEYGSTSFLTSFEQANSYGAQDDRTNRDIGAFIEKMKENNIYTIARVVTFKDELQASNNEDYAIKRDDNGSVWRNHDGMAWVDPYDARSHEYAISIAEEAAKVGFDEINFDYIRFPAKRGLRFCQENTQENRVKTLGVFLDKAQDRLRQYGVFVSVDTYGNICWSKDDNGIGQMVGALAKHADYIAPMLYPSGFASGSFYFEYPAKHPYAVIYRSVKNIQTRIDPKRVRPWLQYFKDYTKAREDYDKFEVREQIRATENIDTSGWMMWSPSSKYHLDYFEPSKKL